jgi:Bacterial RNA polymerase, alpha chain C terminal domain
MTDTLEDPSGVPIEQLSLTIRWYHTLKRNGIHTVGQLAALPEPRLKAMELPPRATLDELRDKVGRLGLSPWDTPAPAGNQADGGAVSLVPRSGGPGRLSSWALRVAAVLLLPAGERTRWAEEWKGELRALTSRKARARFIASLLLAGGRELAVTLRQARPGHKQAGR